MEQLTEAAKKAFPRLEVQRVVVPKNPNQAVEVWLTRGRGVRERLFDPYTGKDLGDTVSSEHPAVKWLVDLHDDLLGGRKGRLVNGVGASCLTLLCLTGVLIWWPGVSRWKRSLIVHLNTGWKRLNWDLHSAVGFWMFLFVLMWGVSGLYLSVPRSVYMARRFPPTDGSVKHGNPIRRRGARVARPRTFRACVGNRGEVALRDSGTRAGHVVRDRCDHVVESRSAARVEDRYAG